MSGGIEQPHNVKTHTINQTYSEHRIPVRVMGVSVMVVKATKVTGLQSYWHKTRNVLLATQDRAKATYQGGTTGSIERTLVAPANKSTILPSAAP